MKFIDFITEVQRERTEAGKKFYNGCHFEDTTGSIYVQMMIGNETVTYAPFLDKLDFEHLEVDNYLWGTGGPSRIVGHFKKWRVNDSFEGDEKIVALGAYPTYLIKDKNKIWIGKRVKK